MIYADYNGHSPLCPSVRKHLLQRIQGNELANPNASHQLGEKVFLQMEKSRKKCAEILGATKNQVIFNSGSSEGITQIFYSLLGSQGPQSPPPLGKKIIISQIEHSCVLQNGRFWQNQGYELIQLSCNQDGLINLEELRHHLQCSHQDISLVSLIAANNETGVIQPYQKMAALCAKYNVTFFSDTTQYIGKCPFHFNHSGMDFAVSSSHKVGGLIGSGIVLAKNTNRLKPLIQGGGQERGIRGGTQNYLAHETYSIALESFNQNCENRPNNLKKQRDQFEQAVKAIVPDCLIIGKNAPRIPGTSLLAFPGMSGKKIQYALGQRGIMVTTSSACSDNKDQMGHVLKAMGLRPDIGQSVIRISLCTENASAQYQQILDSLTQIVKKDAGSTCGLSRV